jgi:hypothetical protein
MAPYRDMIGRDQGWESPNRCYHSRGAMRFHSTDDSDDEADKGKPLGGRRMPRISRARTPRRAGGPLCSIEMFEAPLMENAIAYTVTDGPCGPQGESRGGCIDFSVPTRIYRNPVAGNHVHVRLSVLDGQLRISAPAIYPTGCLPATTTPPPDPVTGSRCVVRLGDEGCTQIDLVMARNGDIEAVLQMETIQRPFNRRDIVQLAREFAIGIDLLDDIIQQEGLRKDVE